jgi:hypothetical protein
METMMFDTIQKYVALGIGVALTHMAADMGDSMPGFKMRVFDPALERLPVAVVTRKHAHLPKPAEEFRRLVRLCLRHSTAAGW